MAKQALILSRHDHGLDVPSWAQVLSDSGFEVWSHCLEGAEKPGPVEAAVGIVLLDLLDIDKADMSEFIDKAVACFREWGFSASRIPLVAIAPPTIAFSDAQLGLFADLLKPPLTQSLISNRLTSLMRLATMRREAERRSATFKHFGVGLPVVPPPRDLDKQNLLYIGSGMALLPIEVALPDSCEVVAALTPSMAEQYMDMQAFDALIVELSDYNAHLVAFVSDLRRNPSYFSLPIILVCHKRALEDGLAGLAAGANDIVSFPFSDRFFENRIELLVREERYRQQLKKIFSEARLLMPTDRVTRLYSEEFLKAHLASMEHEPSRASMTFVGIDVSYDLANDAAPIGDDNPGLLSRVGRFISSLMRAEDMLTRLENGRLVGFFPDTDLHEARLALQRIRSIVQLSPFTEQGTARSVHVSLDFSMHHSDLAKGPVDVDKVLKDLFENPVTRF